MPLPKPAYDWDIVEDAYNYSTSIPTRTSIVKITYAWKDDGPIMAQCIAIGWGLAEMPRRK